MIQKQLSFKILNIFFALGLMLSTGSFNTQSVAYAKQDVAPTLSPLAIEGEAWSQSGVFSIIWGDDSEGASQEIYTLTDDSGQTMRLFLGETLAQSVGGVLAFDRKYVSVEGLMAAPSSDESMPPTINVTSLTLASSPESGAATLNGGILPAVTGSKPWISIMCKFSNFSVEPQNLAYFQGMYSSSYPGLDHYWREVSYNAVNVAGSGASGWFVLPHTEAYYNPTDTLGGTDLSLLATDCIGVADSSVNFSLYAGINMMFNTNFDNGYAWGGSRYMTLDGVTKSWSTTWEPPWGYSDISIIEHEMGHGFGLPHSSGNYGQTYDNAWDVMSKDRYNCAVATHATYGCTAQHTISYHKDKMGWIPSSQKYTPTSGSATITLERLALPATSNYKMAKIPIAGSATHFYTVEVRRQNGYDIKVAGNAVIIHEVDTTRGRPAYVIDVDGDGDTSDAGAMFVVGETFTDATNGISVSVLSSTSSGFQVSITTPGPTTPALSNPANNVTLNRTDSITMFWNTASGATQYYAEFWGGPSTNINSGWTSNTSWGIGSQWGGVYQWRVKSRDGSGRVSGWSETRTLNIKLGTPGSLSASVASMSQINLSWNSSSDAPGNIDGYRIYRDGVEIDTVSSATTTYNDTGRTCGTSYSYTVKAYKGSLESNASNTANATPNNCPPSMPGNLTVSGSTAHSLTLSWQDTSSNETGFKVYRWGYDGTEWIFIYHGSVGANTTSYTENGLDCGNDFNYYKVSAYNANGESTLTGWVQGETDPCPIPSNDDFGTPTTISQVSFTDNIETTGATSATDDPALTDCERGPGYGTVWYSYQPGSDGQIKVDTVGSDYDTMLAVWTGTRGNLSLVACDDDRAGGGLSELTANVYSGTTYYIEAMKFDTVQANSLEALSTKEIILPKIETPHNDLNAQEGNSDEISALSSGGNLQLNFEFGRTDLVITDMFISPSAPAANQPVSVTLQIENQGAYDATGFYVDIYIDRQRTDCSDDGDYWRYISTTPAGSTQYVVVYIQTDSTDGFPQGTYHIRAYVDTNCGVGESNETNNAIGPSTLTVGDPLSPPVNDEISAPRNVPSVAYSDTLDARGATVALDDPALDSCGLNSGKGSVWYQFTPSISGPYLIDTSGSDYDTVLAIWTGTRGSLAEVACNDDIGWVNNSWDPDSILSTQLEDGVQYYIEVTKYGGPQLSGQNTRRSTQSSKPEPDDLISLSGGYLQFHITFDAPSVTSITRKGTNPTSAASVDFSVTFSEPVTSVDISDFTTITTGVTGAFVSSVVETGDQTSYTVTVNTGSGNGTIRLDVVDNNSIIDAASNPLGGPSVGDGDYSSGDVYTVSKLPSSATFDDVPTTYWAWSYIERLYNAGITGGCNLTPLQYCPETTVTRSQMAVFLLRGIHGSSYNPPVVGASTGFGDVPVNYWSAGWIKQLAAEGITGGCGNGNYCPEYPVTRDQMAVFLLRSKYGSSYNPPAVGNSTGFGDVPANHWAAAWIKQLVAEGITSGCGNGNYCPDIPVSRAQMAVFLVRTFSLP